MAGVGSTCESAESGLRLAQEGMSCPSLEVSWKGLINEAAAPIRDNEEWSVV